MVRRDLQRRSDEKVSDPMNGIRAWMNGQAGPRRRNRNARETSRASTSRHPRGTEWIRRGLRDRVKKLSAESGRPMVAESRLSGGWTRWKAVRRLDSLPHNHPRPAQLFMKFRGPKAHLNRRQKTIVCPTDLAEALERCFRRRARRGWWAPPVRECRNTAAVTPVR